MHIRAVGLRAALVALVLLTLLAAWLVADRRDAGSVEPRPVAAAPVDAMATPSAAPATALVAPLPAAVSTLAPGASRAAAPGASAPARSGGTAADRSRAGLPMLAGARLAGSGGLTDVIQDQGAGVPLPGGQTLWIFADTVQTRHDPYFFVTSSGAVTTRGSRALHYAASKGTPIEFLPRTAGERAGQVAGERYRAVWPTGATKLPDGRIIIGFAKYDVTVSTATYTFQGAGLYEYRYRGLSTLTRATPAKRLGTLWSAADGAVGSPLYAGGYLYLTQCENLECYSARAPVSGLAARGSYAWWTGSGWSHDRADRKPMRYGDGRPGRNPSTVYLPDQGVYGAVDTNAGAMSSTALLWVAPNPWGPWSRPARFSLPQCPAAGCYTLNLHVDQSPPGAVRVSYATHGIGPYVRVTDVSIAVPRNASSVTAEPL